MLILLISVISTITIETISEKVGPFSCDPIPGRYSFILKCTEGDMFGNCSIHGEKEQKSFFLNKMTGKKYWEGDPIISGCPRQWRYCL